MRRVYGEGLIKTIDLGFDQNYKSWIWSKLSILRSWRGEKKPIPQQTGSFTTTFTLQQAYLHIGTGFVL